VKPPAAALEKHEPAAAEFIGRLGSLAPALRQMGCSSTSCARLCSAPKELVGALRHRLNAQRAGIRSPDRPRRAVPPHLPGQMYHIAHEALNNALSHAAA
jgi:hypothetical protein